MRSMSSVELELEACSTSWLRNQPVTVSTKSRGKQLEKIRLTHWKHFTNGLHNHHHTNRLAWPNSSLHNHYIPLNPRQLEENSIKVIEWNPPRSTKEAGFLSCVRGNHLIPIAASRHNTITRICPVRERPRNHRT